MNTQPQTDIKRKNSKIFKTISASLLIITCLFVSLPTQGQSQPSRIGIEQPGYILDMAFYYYFADDYVRAIEYFKKYIEIKGDQEVPLRFLGKMALERDYLDDAIEYLERAAKVAPKSEETLYYLGRAYLSDDQTQKGVQTLEQLHELSPGDISTLYILVQVYNQLNDTRKEMIYYRKLSGALKGRGGFNPLLYKSFIRLAIYHNQRKEYADALHYYKEIHQMNPRDFKAAFILGQLYKANGRYAEAAEIHEPLVKIQPNNIQLLHSLVDTLFILNSVKTNYYFSLYKNSTNRMDTLYRAIGEQAKGNNEKALALFKRATRKNKNKLSLQVGLLRSTPMTNLKEKKQAAFMSLYFAQQIQAYPLAIKFASTLNKLLDHESSQTNFKQKFFYATVNEENYSKEANDLAYHYIEFYTYHGSTNEMVRRPKAALSYYLQALKYIGKLESWLEAAKNTDKIDEPSYLKKIDDLKYRKSALLIACGWLTVYDYKESQFDSEKLLLKAKEIDPEDARAYYFLGILYHNEADKNNNNKAGYEKSEQYLLEAQKAFIVASKNNTAPSVIYFHLGVVSEKLGKFEETEKYLLKAIEMDPFNPGYLNFLGYTYSQHNVKLDQAYKYVKTALEEDPVNEAFLDTLGWILFQMKKYEEALGHLLFAKSLADDRDFDDSVISFHIAETYYMLENYPMAKIYYQQTLDTIDASSEPLDEVYLKERINKIKSMYNKKGN
ncbi:MAG: tetratricopeptide repeat protein [Leptospirales bacterium]